MVQQRSNSFANKREMYVPNEVVELSKDEQEDSDVESGVSERLPTASELREQEVLKNEVALLDSRTGSLRDRYREILPQIHESLSKDEKIDLIELIDDTNEWDEKAQDTSVSSLDVAQGKLDAYYKIMSITDGARRRIMTRQENLSTQLESSPVEDSDESAVEKDEDTNFIPNMGKVNEQRMAEQTAQPVEEGVEEEVEEVVEAEANVESGVDTITEQWNDWLDENESFLEADGAISDGFIASKESLMKASGLPEENIPWLEGLIATRETVWTAEAANIMKDARANGFVNNVNRWTGSPADVKKMYGLEDAQYDAVMKRISPMLDKLAA